MLCLRRLHFVPPPHVPPYPAPPSYGAFAPQPSMMPGAGRAMSQLMLRIGGRDLKKMDTFSESDPMCVVSLKSVQTGGRWKEVGRTERIKDTCVCPSNHVRVHQTQITCTSTPAHKCCGRLRGFSCLPCTSAVHSSLSEM